MLDKRKHLRVPLRTHVSCELGDDVVFDAVAIDICLEGSCIESSRAPELGTRMIVITQLPGCRELSRLPATVRWTKPHCFGVQFGLLGARDTYQIAELMQQQMRSSRPD